MIYFGTKEYMQWVKSPAIGMDSTKQGYFSGAVGYLNGGAYTRRSWGAAKKYNMTWNNAQQHQIQPILDYADGVHGTGDIYFANPFTFEQNMLPQWAATPALGAEDAPVLVGDVRPSSVPNGDRTQGYPANAAVYTVNTSAVDEFVFVPIPPGYTGWVGVHATATGTAKIKIIPYTGGSAGTPVDATLLSTSTTTRVTNSVAGSGIGLAISGVGTITLYGIFVQAYQTGRVPASGGFVGGRGQSGMQFISQPVLTEYSAAFNMIAASVELIEVEAWR